MKRTPLSIPEIALIAGTRAAVGAGAALLLGGCLRPEHRKAVGWTLLTIGAITTIPIAIQLLKSQRNGDQNEHASWSRFPSEEYAS
jgi:hypothetical protein